MLANVVSINSTKENVVADLSDGFTQVANALIEHLSATPLTGREFRVMMVIIRRTYGWNQKSGAISEGCLEKATGIDRKNCGKIRRELVKKNILIIKDRETQINTNLSSWSVAPVKKKGGVKPAKGSSTTPVVKNNNGVVHNPNMGSSTTPVGGRLQPQKGVVHNPPLNTKENYKESFKENSPSENTPTQVEVKKSLLEKVQVKNPQAVIATKKGQAVSWGDQTDLDLAKQIHDMAISITHDEKEPSWASWANDIRLMREQDNRTDQQILALFTFANQDSFWAANVLCPAKLREKWGTLAARYNQQRAERSISQGEQSHGAQGNSQSTASATLGQLMDNDW